jgi:hypothetical protein
MTFPCSSLRPLGFLLGLALGCSGGGLFAASAPGSGTVGLSGSSGGSGCSSCGGGGGSLSPGVAVSINVGPSTDGADAGDFYLNEGEPNVGLATTAMLQFSAETDSTGGVEVVRDVNGVLLQVVSPESFCHLTTTSAYAYQLAVYHPGAKGTWNGTTYAVNVGTNLISTWTIENPDASPTVFNRLKITEAPNGGSSRVWTYAYTNATQVWSLALPGGLGEERASQTVDGSGRRVEKIQLVETNGTIRFERATVYTNFSWGEGVVFNCAGTNGAMQTNCYTYFDTVGYTPGANNKPVKTVWNTDGTWSMTENYDASGRPLVRYSGTGSNGIINSQVNTNAAQCWVTVNSYTPVSGYGDDGSYMPDSPRCVTRSFKGTAVSRTYYVYTAGETRTIQCVSPAGAATDAGNLVTITKRYTSGTWQGDTQSVENPDGTMTFYAYSTASGQKTTTVTSGEPNGGKTAIQNGTQTVTVTGTVGEMISRTVKDITGGTVGITLSSETYSNYDGYQRPQRVTYLDGTYEDTAYGCCGVNTTTDRDGVTTQYLYDSLKRTVASTRLGITTTNVLDAAGHTVQTRRIGTDGSTNILRSSGYAATGELTSSTNAFNGVTSVAESFNGNGQRIVTTTNPDGGTRIETYSASGDLEKVTGTAANPVRYEYGVESTSYNGSSYTW